MSNAELQDFLHREPFAPFRIKFTNGESIVIRNPSLVVPLKRDVFVADDSRDSFRLYAMIHIVGVESLSSNGHSHRPPRRKRR